WARREGRAAVPESVTPVDQMTGRELLAAIDEELDRLPPIYREPLLLYFQAELTRDEIAARLGVPPGTVKIRLERGRKRLGDALTKRGVLFGAGLLALMATSPAGASPPRLIEAIQATVAGQVPPAVAALARGVAVNGVLVRTKWAVLAAIGAAVIGLGFAGMSPIAADPPKPVGPSAPNSTAKDDRPNPEQKEQTIAGRVVGADGQPVVADLLLNWIEGKLQPLGKTKADGTFRVTVPVRENGGWLVARAPGHGMD
ncbi:MAG: sigma-70 family RNA polymerase sigma factor, partial [Zavarzinella sp.]|nr:sigma-70 family RNA polymerase sigma factor [Zavarzinella sp.]